MQMSMRSNLIHHLSHERLINGATKNSSNLYSKEVAQSRLGDLCEESLVEVISMFEVVVLQLIYGAFY